MIARARSCSAVQPAAMRRWMTFPMTVVDTIFKAMAQAIPERTIAGHHADLVIAMITASRRATGGFSSAPSARSAAAGARSTTRTA